MGMLIIATIVFFLIAATAAVYLDLAPLLLAGFLVGAYFFYKACIASKYFRNEKYQASHDEFNYRQTQQCLSAILANDNKLLGKFLPKESSCSDKEKACSDGIAPHNISDTVSTSSNCPYSKPTKRYDSNSPISAGERHEKYHKALREVFLIPHAHFCGFDVEEKNVTAQKV